MSDKSAFMVCGDNSLGQLWSRKVLASSKFMEANFFKYQSNIKTITKVAAYKQSEAFCFSDTQIVYRNGKGQIAEFSPGLVKKMVCLESTVIALLNDGSIVDCVTKKVIIKDNFVDICAVNSDIYGAKNNGGIIKMNLESGSSAEVCNETAISVSCTEEKLFAVNKNGEICVITEEKVEKLKTKAKCISTVASESEAVFLDENGCIWLYDFGNLSQIYGMPPIVFVSVGVQHFAAISYNGSLYTWGFNPSGQLGRGNDKPSFDPVKVLDNVKTVCCGELTTLAITGGAPEIPSNFNKETLARFM